jgi:preprotein translocase subunit Sec61beta
MITSRTIVVMCLLVSLLFLLIEAAQAGLLSRWRHELERAISPFYVVFSSVALMVLALVYFLVFDKSLNINEAQDSESWE